ncbi:flavodoxin FldB [Dongshaea marina]|uniref:flavodoxin FldB n=1 Tax=Dongshaea marina TaxID=2047966 RepID=UPI000D3E069E|nr:flavodoxin FldB [Dongshaea marina]
MQIGLFYGSSTCYTEIVAEKIRDQLGADQVHIHNIKDTDVQRMLDYPLLILGISTWDFGEYQPDWEDQLEALDSLDLSGHTVALFGLGDQAGYDEWFQDAMGMLHQRLQKTGCRFIGYWPNDEQYQFEASKALTEDKSQFVGLALDEATQYDLTDERLEQWLKQLQQQAKEA